MASIDYSKQGIKHIKTKRDLAKIVYANDDLHKIVKLLQKLSRAEAEATIHKMELPISYHIFIMSNFSDLMEVK